MSGNSKEEITSNTSRDQNTNLFFLLLKLLYLKCWSIIRIESYEIQHSFFFLICILFHLTNLD